MRFLSCALGVYLLTVETFTVLQFIHLLQGTLHQTEATGDEGINGQVH